MLNDEQKEVVKNILKGIMDGEAKIHFIEGSGGCGKTFVYECLYNILVGKKLRVSFLHLFVK